MKNRITQDKRTVTRKRAVKRAASRYQRHKERMHTREIALTISSENSEVNP